MVAREAMARDPSRKRRRAALGAGRCSILAGTVAVRTILSRPEQAALGPLRPCPVQTARVLRPGVSRSACDCCDHHDRRCKAGGLRVALHGEGASKRNPSPGPGQSDHSDTEWPLASRSGALRRKSPPCGRLFDGTRLRSPPDPAWTEPFGLAVRRIMRQRANRSRASSPQSRSCPPVRRTSRPFPR